MKIGKQSLEFSNVFLKSSSAVVGPYEANGPLKFDFDFAFDDLYCGGKTWEKGEANLLKKAIEIAITKAGLSEADIDFALGGDLINQNVISNYVYRNYNIPFFGIYGACSTAIEGLILASTLIDGQNCKNVMASVSSHNATAERQYRYPTEYGGQKPPSATFTVTGSGVAIVSNEMSKIKITRATTGRIVDAGQKDPSDMGSAMAPAACETIIQHLKDFNLDASYYDLILTGDLSAVGMPVVLDVLKAYGIDVTHNYNDCGLLIYDREKQPVFAGGSGCACSAVVTYSHIIKRMEIGELNKVLIVATGALMNPVIMMQKETIPAIAHAVALERVNI